MVTSEINDRDALKLHYTKKHPTSNKVFKKAFSNTFIDTTKNHSELDFLEIKWINKLQATITMNKTDRRLILFLLKKRFYFYQFLVNFSLIKLNFSTR